MAPGRNVGRRCFGFGRRKRPSEVIDYAIHPAVHLRRDPNLENSLIALMIPPALTM
jgi:hypothetical protein